MNDKATFEEFALKIKDSISDCEDLIVRGEWDEADKMTIVLETYSDALRMLARGMKAKNPELYEEVSDHAVWLDGRIITFLRNIAHKNSCFFYQKKD